MARTSPATVTQVRNDFWKTGSTTSWPGLSLPASHICGTGFCWAGSGFFPSSWPGSPRHGPVPLVMARFPSSWPGLSGPPVQTPAMIRVARTSRAMTTGGMDCTVPVGVKRSSKPSPEPAPSWWRPWPRQRRWHAPPSAGHHYGAGSLSPSSRMAFVRAILRRSVSLIGRLSNQPACSSIVS